MRFGQNVLRMTWKEPFVQFSSKAHCFPVSARISGQCDDFENFHAHKCNSAKTCTAWPEKSVLYNFHGKRTVLPFWREFEASFTILRTLTVIKCDLAKTCCAWPEKSVLYNSYQKRTVFPIWGEFEASLTILRTFTLKNAIWPKRAAHDLKRAFCTIFIKAHCFPFLARISGQCDDFENFHAISHKCAADLKRSFCSIFGCFKTCRPGCDFENFDLKMRFCYAWPVKSVW